MTENTPLTIASEFVHHTNKNIFLTGKAGTGKTTFLHNLKKTLPKRMAIVAPTGVAAINAGGVTIHSFFQLPFGPHIPGSISSSASIHKFNRERINLIKSLDLLVIDEISMVRADMLDAIDEVLRRYKDRTRPFGGVQLLMIGDLHQLSPVIKDEDWNVLKPYYDTVYFFSSRSLLQTKPVRIELTHIYRQSDTDFIALLNRIRENKLDAETLETLNERFVPDFKPADDEGYITLTTHNATAQQINAVKLQEIQEKTSTFEALVTGEFPAYSYPTELSLSVKVGAQVMFVKNDPSREKLFYNGKIGQISSITDDTIYVKCKGDYQEIEVGPEEWKNVKYTLNPVTKEIDEEILGSFTQYPLKLAWAITIHKSQGLTFDKAIIDASASFAHGQVYVALSRCKSFEGMVLSTKIGVASVKTDGTVAAYSRDASDNQPDSQLLSNAKIEFQKSLLFELFDFRELRTNLLQLKRILDENAPLMSPSALEIVKPIQQEAEREIFLVADKFRNQLNQLSGEGVLPEEDEPLNSRIQKAAAYFLDKMNVVLNAEISGLVIETDNAAIRKTAAQALENLQKALFVKQSCIKTALNGFHSINFMQAKANADIDFKAKPITPATSKALPARKGIAHGKLYDELNIWRNDVAAENHVLDYMVLPIKTMLEITEHMPRTPKQLANINGIGKAKLAKYGEEILDIVKLYCKKNGIEKPESAEDENEPVSHKIKTNPTSKKPKQDTRQTSFDLFKSGKTIEEIALERGYTAGTIETHLLHFVNTGEIDIYSLFPSETIDPVIRFFIENGQIPTAEAKVALGDAVTYSAIRAARSYVERNNG
jgi:tRNA uridine 5-carbamoylmethylation protein Kti12